jgi:hypothetical protein
MGTSLCHCQFSVHFSVAIGMAAVCPLAANHKAPPLYVI